MLTRYGTDVLVAVAITVIVLAGLAFWTDERWIKILCLVVAGFLTIFSLNFFRDPDRTFNANGVDPDNLIIAPADGKIVLIKDVEETQYLGTKAKMVSIFMSPLDVHVNRIPMSGVVEHLKYIKGEFRVASDDAAAHVNERQNIGIISGTRKLFFSQVTGFVARRIVCELKVGDTVKAGERFGMIKFGSRVDVYFPPNANILVSEGERMVAGETIMAKW